MFQIPTAMVPVDWKIEMPSMGKEDDMFGGCRSIEGSYTKVKQIGEGTYGQVGCSAGVHCLQTLTNQGNPGQVT